MPVHQGDCQGSQGILVTGSTTQGVGGVTRGVEGRRVGVCDLVQLPFDAGHRLVVATNLRGFDGGHTGD